MGLKLKSLWLGALILAVVSAAFATGTAHAAGTDTAHAPHKTTPSALVMPIIAVGSLARTGQRVTSKPAPSCISSPQSRAVCPPQTDACLYTTFYNVAVQNSNEVLWQGQVTNQCGDTVNNVEVQMTTFIDNCSGATSVPGIGSAVINTMANNQQVRFSFDARYGCEICDNGKPILWPPFQVSAYLNASGHEANGNYTNGPQSQTRYVNLANSPAMQFPCP